MNICVEHVCAPGFPSRTRTEERGPLCAAQGVREGPARAPVLCACVCVQMHVCRCEFAQVCTRAHERPVEVVPKMNGFHSSKHCPSPGPRLNRKALGLG